MARPAAEAFFPALLREALAPTAQRLEFALRLALVCALTALVTQIYATPEAALTIYVAFFLHKEERCTSVLFSVAMLLLVSLVIGVLLLLARHVLEEPMSRVFSMALLSFGLLYLVSASKLRPVGGIFALIIAYALDVLGSVPLGEVATRALLYAWLFVAIPAAVSLAVNLLLGPSPRRLVERALAGHLEHGALLLRAGAAATGVQASVAVNAAELLKWLKLAQLEKTSPATDLAALRQAVQSTRVLLTAIERSCRAPDAALSPALRLTLAATLQEMAGVFRAGAYPLDVAWPDCDADPSASPPLAAELQAVMRQALMGFAVASLAAPAAAPSVVANSAGRSGGRPGSRSGSGFFDADAFSNPLHARYALKATAAAMFCYLLYSLLDWPGIHTCLITCYIVSLGTAAETIEKLGLRIFGCLIGAALGVLAMLQIVPALSSVLALLLLVFVGMALAAYVAGGGPRIAYAGFQIGFAFLLCVVQGAAPAFDLSVARDRIIGILLGNAVVYGVFTRCWPVSVAARVDPALRAVQAQLLAVVQAVPAQRVLLAAALQAKLAALRADLDLIAYEPPRLQPAPHWLRLRREAAEALAGLDEVVLLTAWQAVSPQQGDSVPSTARDAAPNDGLPVGQSEPQYESLPGLRLALLRSLPATRLAREAESHLRRLEAIGVSIHSAAADDEQVYAPA